MSKPGKPPSFSTIPVSFHNVDNVRDDAAEGKTCETTEYKLI